MIAKELRVSLQSVQRWRRTWAEGGSRALNSGGPASLPRLSDEQFAQLERELTKGPAARMAGRTGAEPWAGSRLVKVWGRRRPRWRWRWPGRRSTRARREPKQP
ncbi:helix-turn-helix domain-containing protein (plasmid) [Streptomyces sp. NBC_01591]|nr:helix-turn-helix domain-containing protein [Streptomyces sp. NBC_01591]WSD74058.1 helix-turn-helix domain-containing protein [Streptomyces sp. NBC_01591]